MFYKRTKEERMKDEVLTHLQKNRTTLKAEVALIGEKKSTLPASLREYAKIMLANEIASAPKQEQEIY